MFVYADSSNSSSTVLNSVGMGLGLRAYRSARVALTGIGATFAVKTGNCKLHHLVSGRVSHRQQCLIDDVISKSKQVAITLNGN